MKLLDDLEQNPDNSLAITAMTEEDSFLLSTDKLKALRQYQEQASLSFIFVSDVFSNCKSLLSCVKSSFCSELVPSAMSFLYSTMSLFASNKTYYNISNIQIV